MSSGPDTTGLVFRQGYFHDRAAFLALADLLRDIFDIDISLLDRFGGPNPESMPFGYFDAEGRCVANFSAFPMPLVIKGRPVRAVGYQSGAVRPGYRGQGLYRDLMRRAFGWAKEQGFELGLLLTDKPGLYAPYGFRSVPQHAFLGSPPAGIPSRDAARPLSLERQDDVDLLTRLLRDRQPVSDTFAVAGPMDFLLNACFDPDVQLSYLPESDAVVAWKIGGNDAFLLLDIVGRSVPFLAEVIGGLNIHPADVTVHFPIDRLGWPEGKPVIHTGVCDLMVAKMTNIDIPEEPFMLSPMAEF